MMARLPWKVLVISLLWVPLLLMVTPSSAAPAQGPTSTSVHLVQLGETLFSIARAYGVNVLEIAKANHLVNPHLLYAGQQLVIPGSAGYVQASYASNLRASAAVYTVQPGDTMYSICTRHGTTVAAVAQANNLTNAHMIYAGQKLVIPGAQPAVVTQQVIQPAVSTTAYSAPAAPQPAVQRTVSSVAPSNYAPPAHASQPSMGNGGYVDHSASYQQPMTYGGYSDQGKMYGTAPYPYTPYAGHKIYYPDLKRALCNPSTRITFPRNDEVLEFPGTFDIRGTASIDNFQFYKLELGMGKRPIEFWSIDEVKEKPVTMGFLVRDWNTGALPEGTYTLRLTVVDKTGNYPAPCDVIVHVKHPYPDMAYDMNDPYFDPYHHH
jgi:LysM repeat protein